MPAAKTQLPKHPLFREICHASNAIGEHNDCSVKAVAILTDTPYEIVHQRMAIAGRKSRRGTPMGITGGVITSLGYRWLETDPQTFINQYPKSHQILKGVTSHHPERFNKVWKNGKRYLLFNNSHALAVVNGETIDWSQGRALRIKYIWEIIKR